MIPIWDYGANLKDAYTVHIVTELWRGQFLLFHASDSCFKVSIRRSTCIRPKDNAQAERINNTIKNELLKGYRFTDIEQVRQAVRAAVEFYNTERPHMSIDMRTPVEAYLCSGELVKRWKSYRIQAIKRQHEVLDIPTNVLTLPVCQGAPSDLRPPVNP